MRSCSARLLVSVFPGPGCSGFLHEVSAAVATPLDAHHDEQLRMEDRSANTSGCPDSCLVLATADESYSSTAQRMWARLQYTGLFLQGESWRWSVCIGSQSRPSVFAERSILGAHSHGRGAPRDNIPAFYVGGALLHPLSASVPPSSLSHLHLLVSGFSTCRVASSSLHRQILSPSFLGNAPCPFPLRPHAKPRALLFAEPAPTFPSSICRPRTPRHSMGGMDQSRRIPPSTVSLLATTTSACGSDGRNLFARRWYTRHQRLHNPTPPRCPLSSYPHPGVLPLARAAPHPLPQRSTWCRSGPPCHAQRRGSQTCTARPSRRVCVCRRSAAIS